MPPDNLAVVHDAAVIDIGELTVWLDHQHLSIVLWRRWLDRVEWPADTSAGKAIEAMKAALEKAGVQFIGKARVKLRG